MTSIAIAIAALVLGHAPAIPYRCSPVPAGELGVTHVEQGVATSVTLAPRACFGVFMLGATAQEREWILTLNPSFNVDELEAEGLLALLHESEHAAGRLAESDAECTAIALLPTVLDRFSVNRDPGRLQLLAAIATSIHRTLPPSYRIGC